MLMRKLLLPANSLFRVETISYLELIDKQFLLSYVDGWPLFSADFIKI